MSNNFVGDYPLINYYLCNPTTHAHTLMHHCWNLLKKREKYSPWKEAVGQRFLVQKGRQTHTHISGAKGETITDIWSSPRRISACVEPIQEDTWTSGERTVVCQPRIGREESLRVKRKQVQCL